MKWVADWERTWEAVKGMSACAGRGKFVGAGRGMFEGAARGRIAQVVTGMS